MSTTQPTDPKLITHITAQLGEDGREAVSRIHSNLQHDGWRGLGTLSQFETLCERLGFHVYHGRNERNQSTIFVSIHPAPAQPEPAKTGFILQVPPCSNVNSGMYLSRFTSCGRPAKTRKLTEARIYKTRATAEKAAIQWQVGAFDRTTDKPIKVPLTVIDLSQTA